APLEQLQQRLAGDAARPVRRLEVAAELILQHPVDALDLLLLAQLHAVAGELRLPRLSVLPRREVAPLDRALLRVAALALQEQLHALAAAQPADGPRVSRHVIFSLSAILPSARTAIRGSDAAPLRGAAAVVGDRRDVADRLDLDPDRLQRADGGLAPGSRTGHPHVHAAQPHGLRRVARGHRRLRRGKRRPLARALEPDRAGARPGDDVPLRVGNRHDGVVERRLDVGEPGVDHALLAALLERLLAAGLAGALCLGHGLHRLLLGDRAPARALPRPRVRARALAAHRQPAAMPQPPVAADLHQPLDVERHFLAEIALDA